MGNDTVHLQGRENLDSGTISKLHSGDTNAIVLYEPLKGLLL